MKAIQINYIPGDVRYMAQELGMSHQRLVVVAVNYLLGAYPAASKLDLEEFLTNDDDCRELLNINEALNAGVKKPEPRNKTDSLKETIAKMAEQIDNDFLEPGDRPGYDSELDVEWRGPLFNMLETLIASMNGIVERAERNFERFEWHCIADERSYAVYYNTNGIRAKPSDVVKVMSAVFNVEN